MTEYSQPSEKHSPYELCIVVPAFNEEENIVLMIDTLLSVLKEVTDNYEIIIVDDGSPDHTLERAEESFHGNSRIKIIKFSRNFGKEAAITAGLESSRAMGVVVIDGDLQHPPGLIKEMAGLWRYEGAKVVHAVKRTRQRSSAVYGIIAGIFYGLFRTLSGYNLRNACDFKLMDREVVQRYIELPETLRFFRGLIPWFGYRSRTVYFEPADRGGGSSGWSYIKLFKMGINAICSFSVLPVHIITFLGFFLFFISMALGIHTLYMKFSGVAVEGFTTVILLLLFIGSTLMVSLGIIGQYLAMIYKEIKHRPQYIIQRKINFEKPTEKKAS